MHYLEAWWKHFPRGQNNIIILSFSPVAILGLERDETPALSSEQPAYIRKTWRTRAQMFFILLHKLLILHEEFASDAFNDDILWNRVLIRCFVLLTKARENTSFVAVFNRFRVDCTCSWIKFNWIKDMHFYLCLFFLPD